MFLHSKEEVDAMHLDLMDALIDMISECEASNMVSRPVRLEKLNQNLNRSKS